MSRGKEKKMEKYIGITITQRERENIARLSYALAQQVDDYPAQLSHYLAYVSDQLVVDIQSLVDVVGRITSAMGQDEPMYDRALLEGWC